MGSFTLKLNQAFHKTKLWFPLKIIIKLTVNKNVQKKEFGVGILALVTPYA